MNQYTICIYENTIGKVVFAYDADFWIDEIPGISSVDVKFSESQIIRQVGAKVTNRKVLPKDLTINGCVFGGGNNLEVNRRHLLDVFAPDVDAKFTVIQDGETWYLDAFPVRTPEISPGEGVQDFQIRLRAPYPYWRNKMQSKMAAGVTAAFEFPFYTGGEWWVSEYSASYFETFTNSGNVPIAFRAVFSARTVLRNPEIYHMGTGKVIRFSRTMAAGEQLIVSTHPGEQRVVAIDKDGNSTNGFRFLTIDSDLSMALLPGDNLLRTDAAENRKGLIVNVEYSGGERSGV